MSYSFSLLRSMKTSCINMPHVKRVYRERLVHATSVNLSDVNAHETVSDKSKENIQSKTQSALHLSNSLIEVDRHRATKYWQSKGTKYNKFLAKNSEDTGIERDSDIPLFLRMKHKRYPDAIETQFSEIKEYIKSPKLPEENVPKKLPQPVSFPYQKVTRQLLIDRQERVPALSSTNENEIVAGVNEVASLAKFDSSMKKMEKTFSEYFKYLEHHNVDNIKSGAATAPTVQNIKDEMWKVNYGSPDPVIAPSDIPCGGCGALIHCQDSGIPGYVPSERFQVYSEGKSYEILCQRCTFFKEHNVALNVNVTYIEYPKILSQIKKRPSLVVLLVDLTDFPCSIWPGVIDIIGHLHKVVVVGTKVDLLPRDGPGYLTRVMDSLSQSLKDYGVDRGENILGIHLISAKTGFGIETLISKINRTWQYKGDVFLIGCTNVGKSTLFNALLQSDFCYIQAVDLIQRATTSIWPGTTLNLLKFPMQRPSGISETMRMKRLAVITKEEKKERALRLTLYRETKDPKYATLIGRVGITSSCIPTSGGLAPKTTFYPPTDHRFNKGHFCYDTPGSLYKDQILDLLTIDELMKTLPKDIITPRTFALFSEQTLFLAGLARLDVVEVENLKHMLITVFSSPSLPVHIIDTKFADQFYTENLGSLLEVPAGGPERLVTFPKLKSYEFLCTGIGDSQSAADIVLSSAGWASLTIMKNQFCRIKAYTPDGRGCYLREPSLLPHAVKLRGTKIKYTPAYNTKLSSAPIEETKKNT